jgi:hypothetical protein
MYTVYNLKGIINPPEMSIKIAVIEGNEFVMFSGTILPDNFFLCFLFS